MPSIPHKRYVSISNPLCASCLRGEPREFGFCPCGHDVSDEVNEVPS